MPKPLKIGKRITKTVRAHEVFRGQVVKNKNAIPITIITAKLLVSLRFEWEAET